ANAVESRRHAHARARARSEPPGFSHTLAMIVHQDESLTCSRKATFEMVKPPDPGRVFISYARADNTIVQRLIGDLRKFGINIWIDRERIAAGSSNFEAEIRRGLQESRALVYVASPRSLKSDYVQGELAVAQRAKDSRGKGIMVYPV